MHPVAYQMSAARTEAPAVGVLERLLTLPKDEALRLIRLNHAAIGMHTEAGEFADVVKKALYYGKPLDTVNLFEELGDQLWYIALAANSLGINLSKVMDANEAKLRARYPDKFTEERAATENRDVEKEMDALVPPSSLPSCGVNKHDLSLNCMQCSRCLRSAREICLELSTAKGS